HQVRSLIREMATSKAIVVSTHILEEVEAVCSRAVIIARGRLLADGTPEELVARASNHNAVVIAIDAAHAETARRHLESLSSVKAVDSIGLSDGVARLRVMPRNAGLIAADIGELARAKNIPVREMFVERGALDEVFRAITTGSPGSRAGAADA
ncbi:MAG: ABC transporter ATP-binding protein, partial [Rhodospirillales bacterium]|nr:ABC transporter ATP-binding protein [Rhodospirillales bacterium]